MIRVTFIVIAGWLVTAATSTKQAVQCDIPLTEPAIKQLLTDGVPAAGLRRLFSTCGIDLGLATADATESRLKQIGVSAAALTALAPPANPMAGTTWVSPFDRRPMVFISAGRFRMGSDGTELGREADEEPHEVVVANGFWMDAAEVSNESYRRFIISRPEWQKDNATPGLKGANYLKNWQGTSYPEGQGSAPVVWVNWHAARAYAAWAGKRLPAEAEWEHAARGGTTTRFWWGSEFDPQRVVRDTQAASVAPQRRTNPWGVGDATGSVWEWTSTLYRPYPYSATDGREDARSTGARVVRGGSWVNGEAFLRVANRSSEEAAEASDLIGFRCVR